MPGSPRIFPHQGSMCLLEEVLSWDLQRIACRSSSHRADRQSAARARPARRRLRHRIRGAGDGGPRRAAAMSAGQRQRLWHARQRARRRTAAVARLDDCRHDLLVSAQRLHSDAVGALYSFALHDPASGCWHRAGEPAATRAVERHGAAAVMAMTPSGRRALVTGGSGGVGAAICRRLAQSGHHVYVHAHRAPRAGAGAGAGSFAPAGLSAETLCFDVTDAARHAGGDRGSAGRGPDSDPGQQRRHPR